MTVEKFSNTFNLKQTVWRCIGKHRSGEGMRIQKKNKNDKLDFNKREEAILDHFFIDTYLEDK